MKKLTLTQMQLTDEGGMCYVIRQENDSFIIIDGGMGGNSYREHADLLFSILKEENERPVIEGWFITHFHCDHIDLASGFLLEYKDEIEVKLFAYNHPGHEDHLRDIRREEEWQRAMDAHPDAKRCVLKTGETLDFDSCRVTVLLSEDDEGSAGGRTGQNSISAALTFDFKSGKKFIALGDCDTQRMHQLIDDKSKLYRTKEELKSDILQVAHHGIPMGSFDNVRENVDLYKIISPSICFFDVDREYYLTNPRFKDEKWADNYYLLHSGAECYDNKESTVVDLHSLITKRIDYKSKGRKQ